LGRRPLGKSTRQCQRDIPDFIYILIHTRYGICTIHKCIYIIIYIYIYICIIYGIPYPYLYIYTYHLWATPFLLRNNPPKSPPQTLGKRKRLRQRCARSAPCTPDLLRKEGSRPALLPRHPGAISS